MKLPVLIILVTLVLTGCVKKMINPTADKTPADSGKYTYLALGDSYTIGEAVERGSNFPDQLKNELPDLKNPVIIARTGWTTGELIAAINASGTTGNKYDIVTLLIGVNNQYRGQSQDTYRAEFVQLLHTAIAYANGNKKHVFVLSIPDWGVTPFASGRDRNQIAREIDQFNAINKQETGQAGVVYVDITPISKKAANDAALTAEDGLHPSAKMYGLWVKELAPVVLKGLN